MNKFKKGGEIDMKIFQQGEIDVSKPNVFIDVDDVILNSSDTVIDI